MKITIKEDSQSEWMFDIDKIEDEKFKNEIENYTNKIIKCANEAFLSNIDDLLIFGIKVK